MRKKLLDFMQGRFGILWCMATLLSIATISVNSLSASESYQFVAKWGSNGTGDGQFNAPWELAVDTSGNVYVIDYGYNSRIQKFSSDGAFITKWGSYGDGDGQFNYPQGIAVDASGNVYVADTENHRIQKFSPSGAFIKKMGAYGITAGRFVYPKGIAVDASGNLYVGDNYYRIQKFDSGGYYITMWGSRGTGDSQFITAPLGVAVDTSGNVFVADSDNSRIQKFSSDGAFITKWGSYGSEDGQFMWPKQVAVDSSGNVYVADSSNNRIQKFSSSGTFLTKLGGFNKPCGVSIDASGNVYVADTYNYSIQKFSPVTISSPTVTTGSPTNVTSSSATLNGTVNANGASTTAWFNYGTASGSYTGTSTTQSVSGSSDTSVSISVSGLSLNTTYYYMLAAQNTAGTSYGSETSFTTSASSDTTAPTGSLNINSGASYTNSTAVVLNLSATDAVGVTGYYISETLSYPSASASGWVSVTSTTSYSATVPYSLSGGEGDKTIYVWYKDAAGNVSSVASATITLDATVPTVTISSPTSSPTYTATSSTISLGGSASDSASGISSVSWSNDRGGNGTATGTASWTVFSISLSSGDNVITVTAKDGAGNSGTDTLQVTYSTGTTVSAPTVSTGSASSVTTSSATLNGTVNANGGTATACFQYGITSGSYTGTSTTQSVTGSSNTNVSIGISGLSSGTNYYYRIAAQNSAGTSYGSESSFTTTSAATPIPTPSTGDTTPPTVTITSPTSGSTYTTTSSAITLSGTASDNSGSVSSVTWSNSKGGSGTASGTTSWTISDISLSSGDNVITVTATDSSGNSGTDTITVTYSASTKPTVLTGSATDVTATSATLTGTVNANGLSTTAWFEYGTVKGTYGNKTTTQTVTGSNDTTVSSTITGLTAETTYYYRIAAQNNSGTSYGEEMSFQYSSKGSAPTVATEAATSVTDTSATLNGKCNPNGLSTTVWFEYGTLSGTYEYKTSTQGMSGSSYTKVSAAITGLTAGTTYYYRIAAKNSVGTSYGTEMEFYKSPGTETTPTPVTTPTPTTSPVPTPAPTLPPLPTPSPAQEGIVFGFVNDEDEQALEGVTVTITGAENQVTETDENGYYEFSGLDAGEYTLTYEKEGFLAQTINISLEEGELKDVETVILEQVEKGKIYGYAVNIKGEPIEFARLKLKGIKTKVTKSASSDADGFFEFTDLNADTYVIIAKKKGYRKNQQKVTLEEGTSEEIEIVMKKTSKRIIKRQTDED